MTELALKQRALEEQMTALGRGKVRAQYERMHKLRDFSSTVVGASIRDNSFSAVLEQIRFDWKKRRPPIGAPIESVKRRCRVFWPAEAKPEFVAAIAVCALVDCLMLRLSYPAACNFIGRAIDDELRFLVFRRQHPDYWREVEREKGRRGEKQAKRNLHKIAKEYIDGERATVRECSKAGMYMLSVFERVTTIFTVEKVIRPNGRAQRYIVPTESARKWIDAAVEHQMGRTPYYLPCVEVPRDWENPYVGGHLGYAVAPRPLLRSHRKEYLRALESADLSQVYSAVNALQRTAWRINRQVFDLAEAMYKTGVNLAGCNDGVRQRVTADLETEKRDTEAGREYRRRVSRIFASNRLGKVQRLAWGRSVATARLFRDCSFYYPHHLDFRGRVYPTSACLTPQGDDLSISLLQFADSQKLETDRDWFWVKVHGANVFGVDKVPFAERLAWVDANYQKIRESARDPLGYRWWADASSPMSFLAWCSAYADSTEKGADWHLPIQIDGSNNGLQIYSFLLRDPVGGAATNCLPGPRPYDIYQDVADVVSRKLGSRAAAGDSIARRWLDVVSNRMPRQATKRIVMTLVYGASKFACLRYTAEWFEEFCLKTGCKEFAAELWPNIRYLSDLIWDSIDAVVVSARKGMNWLRACADVFSENKLDVHWTTPAGFEVLQRYTKLSGQKSVKLCFGKRVDRVAYRDLTRYVDPQRQRNGLAPNVIHSLDAAILMLVVNKARDAGCTSFRAVHDSYGALPKDMDTLSRAVRSVYADVFSDNWFATLWRQWQNQMPEGVVLPEPPKQGLMSIEAVHRSLYFFA